MKWLSIFLILIPISAWSSSFCTKNEMTFFSCNIRDEIISVCVSNGVAQFRSGNTKKISFKYPSDTVNSKEKFFLSEMGASGHQEKHLRFNHEDKTFVIYDRWHLDHSTGKERIIRGISIFEKKAIPLDGDRAEFKREFLIEEKVCKQSIGIKIAPDNSVNFENEDFIYGP